jgi:hypothetical protein
MPRIDDYKAAKALAVADLRKSDPLEVANRSRSQYFVEGGGEGLVVPYFGQGRRITWPEITVASLDSTGEISLPEQVLILHYLVTTGGEPVKGECIDFRQVPGGGFYWTAFVSRAKKPLLETFGADPDLYLRVAVQLGGMPQDLGDAAAQFQAFPLIPITHVLWRGDEEFPPDASILFDETIPRHLPTEDIAALSGVSVYRLMGAARQLRRSH